MSNDRDERTEDALRRALSAQAGQVSPGGDGLMKIQQRVAARDARMRWLRPVLAGGVTVVVIAAGVGGYAIARNNGGGNASVQVGHSSSPTPHDVATVGYPTDAIFPFTTAGDEQTWETSFAEGNSPWVSDPTAVTESWISYYLLEHGKFEFSAQTTGASSDVTVSRKIGGTDHPVTIVHLVKYHNAWLVTGASDAAAQLAFTSPTPGAAVTSPVTVTGRGYGVDEQALVQVRNAMTADLFGSASTGPFGNGTPQWSASVPFTATSDAGVVVATVDSPADGGLGALAAEKVTFGASGHAVAASDAYAVEGGSLVKLDPTTGASEGPVSAADAEGTVAEVHQDGDTLYFTAGAPDCPTTIYSMPAAGGTPTKVATALAGGYGITGFDVGTPAAEVTYFESGCGSQAGSGALVFTHMTNRGDITEPFASLPPVVEGDPVWESDGVHVDAFIKTGMEGYLGRYNTVKMESELSPTAPTSACPGFNIDAGLPNAITEGPDGNLWVAVQTGTSMQVVSCTGTKPTTEFTVSGNETPQSLSINSSGQALLVGDSGKVWSWTPGTTSPRALSEASGVTSVAW